MPTLLDLIDAPKDPPTLVPVRPGSKRMREEVRVIEAPKPLPEKITSKNMPSMADVHKMTKSEQLLLLDKLRAAEAEILEKEKIAMEADPFWFYEPSLGAIGPAQRDFLLRHLKPEDVPQALPGQMDVHKSICPIRGASGGNQSGKTTVGAIEAFIQATGEVPDALKDFYPRSRLPADNFKTPQHVRVVGKDWENGILLNVLPTYQRWVPKEYLENGQWTKSYSAEKATLFLQKRGRLTGTIEFMSNAQNVTSFQGPPRDKMIYDEEPRLEIYKENLLRFATRARLDIMFCMTPTEGLTWVYDMVQSGQDVGGRRIDWFKLSSVGNKLANLEVLEAVVQDLTYEEKLMRLLGEFVSISGLVYGRQFSRQVHLMKPFDVGCTCDTATPHEGRHVDGCPWNDYVVYRGMDPHLVTPTAVVWVAVDRFENYYIVNSWFKEADVDKVKEGVAGLSSRFRLGWSVVDSAADSDIAAFGGHNIFQKLRRGDNRIKNLRLATKGQGSIRTGVDEIKSLLQVHPISNKPRLFIFDTPENRLLIKAFETLERDRGAQEDKRGQRDRILESKHHLHAAMRYVFMQRVRWRDPEMVMPPDSPQFSEEEVYG